MENMNIAKTILNQLGGNKFIVMTGAKNVIGGENFLQFQIGRNSKGITNVKIILNSLDLYDMTFYKMRSPITEKMFKPVAECNSIYGDMLDECFEKNTGLLTKL